MRNLFTLSLFAALAALGNAQMVQISEGHTDLGLGYSNGVWDPHVHAEDLNEEFETDAAYLYYGAASRTTRPTSAAYNFTGVAAGAPVWRNYTNNVAGMPWLGFGLEEIARGTFGSYVQTDDRRDPISAEWVELQLKGFTAPTGGNVSFFQGSSSAPQVWFATADGLDASDKFISTVGGHEHGSFLFTAPGIYTLTFQASALGLDGSTVTSPEYTYTFGVEAQPVPEPASLAALGLGVVAMIRRRRKASA